MLRICGHNGLQGVIFLVGGGRGDSLHLGYQRQNLISVYMCANTTFIDLLNTNDNFTETRTMLL